MNVGKTTIRNNEIRNNAPVPQKDKEKKTKKTTIYSARKKERVCREKCEIKGTEL